MKLLLYSLCFLNYFTSWAQDIEVDTIANPHLAEFSKIVHHVPKRLIVENAPEKWKNYPVNSIASLLELFDNADRFSASDSAWAKTAAEQLAIAFYEEDKYIILSFSGYSGGPKNRLREVARKNKKFTAVLLCIGCKCTTTEMQIFMDAFNDKIELLVCGQL